MGRVIMDGGREFTSAQKAANWLHATGQTRAQDARSVRDSVNRAIRNGGKAYGHTFESVDGKKNPR